MSIQSKLEQLKASSKSVVIKKLIAKFKRKNINKKNREIDFEDVSYFDYSHNYLVKSLSILKNIDINYYKDNFSEIETLYKNLKDNKYNLLGSGLVEVSHNQKYSYQGISFDNNLQSNITSLINQSNKQKSQEILELLPKDYKLIDWQVDFRSGYRWSENKWYKDIKYGDVKGADIKLPWELGRMQDLPVLAIGYYISKDEKYIKLIENKIIDFICSNPPRFGCQWMTSMDVAIRAINWIVCLDILADADVKLKHNDIILNSLCEHIIHIENNLEYSQGQRGNHYLANIVGLYIISYYLDYQNFASIRQFAEDELIKEIDYQFNDDGSNFEASLPYHIMSYEFILFALNYFDKSKLSEEASANLDKKLNKKLKNKLDKIDLFTKSILSDKNTVFQIGDNDSGRLLKLMYWKQNNYDSKFASKFDSEFDDIMFYDYLNVMNNLGNQFTNHFPDFGLVVHKNEKYHFAFRNGGVGQNGKGGHAHNDNLSFCLNVIDDEIIVDAGTYNYTSFPELRNKYRSLSLHNSIIKEVKETNLILDGQENLFWLYEKVNSKLDLVDNIISASHSAYNNDNDGLCSRKVELNKNEINFVDTLVGEFSIKLHFAPNVELTIENNILFVNDNIEISFDNKKIEIFEYDYSPSYGSIIKSKYIEVRAIDKLEWEIKVNEDKAI